MTFILMFFAAYLLGSVSSAVIVCKLMGLPDPRTEGSKNPGATNVLRLGGKGAALLVLAGDSLKAVIPVLIGAALGLNLIELAGIVCAAFIGHLFPIFFGFQGGKGVATFIGGLLALHWPSGLCWLVCWLIVAGIFRYSSLAALVASSLAPLYFYYFTHSLAAAFLLYVMVILLIFRHHTNITNLMTRKEKRLF